MAKYYKYTLTDPSIKDVQSLLEDITKPTSGYLTMKKDSSITIQQIVNEFLNFVPDDGDQTNLSIINEALMSSGLKYSEINQTNPQLIPNITINIPYDRTNLQVMSVVGQDLETKERSYKAFMSNQIYNILSDPKFKRAQKYYKIGGDILTDYYPQIEVWIWMRSLDTLVNITQFIENLNTSVGQNGGAFSFNLSPINGVPDPFYTQYTGHLINQANLHIGDKNKRNNFFFHNYISVNDLVFIKFEQLESDETKRNRMPLYLDYKDIPNKIYDMIGLVDTNTISISPETNNVTIEIKGRDLSKLFIEDGSYFMPISYVSGVSSFFTPIYADKDKYIKRVFSSDEYLKNTLFAGGYRNIAFNFQFFINQCSTIGIIPNEVFSGSGYKYDKFGNPNDRLSKRFKATKTGELQESPESTDGLWSIIKLCVDEQLSSIRVADNSLSSPDGTMQSQFQKICQEPFVEYFSDTYGDQYVIIVRRPPFTKDAILSLKETTVETTDKIDELRSNKETKITNREIKNLIIDIYDDDVINEVLMFNEDDIFTFFKLDSSYINFSGNSENFLPFLPVIYFPEYVEIWGNKKFEISDNYVYFKNINDCNRNGLDMVNMFKSIVNDMKFCIDIYAYMPFVRKGTITLNGDRTIKRGSWIRYTGTGELFYVESVTNSYSISDTGVDRTTTLNVNRGMVEKFIEGVDPVNLSNNPISNLNKLSSIEVSDLNLGIDGKYRANYKENKKISYFNIINTENIAQTLIDNFKKGKTYDNSKTFSDINKEVFEFFLKRRQFDYV